MSDGARCHYCHKNRCECGDFTTAEYEHMKKQKEEIMAKQATDCEQRLRSIHSLASAIINAQFDANTTKEAIRRIRGLSGGCKDGD